MKRLLPFCLINLLVTSAFADSYTISLPNGASLIANHLNHPGGNTLNNILPNPPLGTYFYKRNCVGWTTYFFDPGSAAWLPDGLATLNPGEGAVISAVATTITFTGTPGVPVLPVVLPCGCNQTNLISRQTSTHRNPQPGQRA